MSPRKKSTETETSTQQEISLEQNEQQTTDNTYEFNTRISSEFFPLLTETDNMESFETIQRWIEKPMLYNQQLRNLSRKMYNENGIYTNTIDYMVAMPTLANVVYGNSKKKSFKNKKQLFIDILDSIRHKEQVRDILLSGMIDGTYFGYFETISSTVFKSGDSFSDYEIDNMESLSEINKTNTPNVSIMQLPTDYCKIIGIQNNSYVMAFDMSYFDQFISNGLSLKLKKYPKEIRDKYKTYVRDKSRRWFVLNNDNTIVLKFRANRKEPWGRPLGLASFISLMYSRYLTETKRNLLDGVNTTIIYQTFPEKDGVSVLTQKGQELQHNNVKNALFSSKSRKGINFFSLAGGTKIDKVTFDIELLKQNLSDELIKQISSELGFASGLLTGESNGSLASQTNNLEMISSEIFNWLEQITNEINKVVNKNLIKDDTLGLKLYYLPLTSINKDKMISNMKELYTLGKGSLRAWIASTGMNSEAYISMMDEEIEDGFDTKYVPHATSYTLSDSADSTNPPNNVGIDKGGRPEKSVQDMTDSGLKNKQYKGKV